MRLVQYALSDGKRSLISIEISEAIEAMAAALNAAGWNFEIDSYDMRDIICMDCCDDERRLSVAVCPQGKDVRPTVIMLVEAAHAVWIQLGQPLANGARFQACVKAIGEFEAR